MIICHLTSVLILLLIKLYELSVKSLIECCTVIVLHKHFNSHVL